MASIGKLLIVDKTNGQVIHFLSDMPDGIRPPVENLVFVELPYGQDDDKFLRLKDGVNSIKVADIGNKILEFDLVEAPPTSEQQIAQLQQQLLQAQGVV